jgi:hypothetical protein
MGNNNNEIGYNDDELDMNERLAQRDVMMPANSGTNHVFDNLPVMTREVSNKKKK